MSFLTPLYLFGIIAVGLPILLHLVRHQPKNVFHFSSLRFLEHKPPQTNRKNKIEHWLLLSLRALAVILLVAAFARPFFKNRDLELTTTQPPNQTILLIDTSASMQRHPLWEQALTKANEIAHQTAPEEIAIYTFDSRLKAIKPLRQAKGARVSGSLERNQSLLADLSPGWQATDLGAALTELASLLQEQAVSDPTGSLLRNTTIELITDFQAGSQTAALSQFSWPEELRVQLHQLKSEQPGNAGLQLLTLDAESQPTVRIVNAADSEQEQFKVTYESLPGQTEESQQVYVPRGQSRVIRLAALDQAAPVPQIVLSGDQQEFDNRLFLQPPTRASLTVVHYGTPTDNSIESANYFARRAFPSTRQREIDFQTLGPDSPPLLLSATDIHLMLISRQLAPDETEQVQRYLEQGGVVLFTLHDDQTTESLNQLAAPTENASQRIKTGTPEINGYALLTDINFEHPLFQIFQAPEFSDFTRLKFWNYRDLKLPEQIPHQVLARFDHQSPAILELKRETGTLLVMTFGWTPQESQFALSTKFVPMLNAILALNDRALDAPAQFTIGQKVKLTAAEQTRQIRTPDRSVIQLASGQQEFVETVQPGLYQVQSESKPAPGRQFAVNLDISESQTEPLAQEKLEALGVRFTDARASTADKTSPADLHRQAQLRELEQKQQLWRWLIIVALALLGLETVLAKWMAGKSSATGKA
ncbi:hypothetical protein Pan153_13320 [Gimesia panareensis]|uniref:VWFA domain-containing protein n=1 Tax=Gimesia panareensis TaxID=2527978 RepID=A0A518FK31_9PLAN|nr:BatA and WFA domain-containing protein [Gimesia panareensis]QDV16701.1 hypothetical protein Pan153_13320 [Gimesia panareensis]